MKAESIARNYNIDISACSHNDTDVKSIKNIVKSFYCAKWKDTVSNSCSSVNSSLRLYKLFKRSFSIDPYLLCVTNDKHRSALSRFRCSSHQLQIEKCRHQANIPPIWERVCPFCRCAVDDELHLLLFCRTNANLRCDFMSSIAHLIPNLDAMHHLDQFTNIISSSDKFVLRKLAKFVYNSLEIRKCLI